MTVNEIFAQATTKPVALATAILGNLIPFFGVLFLGWDAAQILILYWVENVVLGVLTLPRLIATSKSFGEGAFLVPFFIVHYGLFCFGHLTFAFLIVADFGDEAGGLYGGLFRMLHEPSFLWAVAAVVALNLFAQIREWWWPGKWRTSDAKIEMFKPYGRIFVLHLTVLFGSAVVMMLGGPVAAILILCLLKALLEVRLLAFSEPPVVLAEKT